MRQDKGVTAHSGKKRGKSCEDDRQQWPEAKDTVRRARVTKEVFTIARGQGKILCRGVDSGGKGRVATKKGRWTQPMKEVCITIYAQRKQKCRHEGDWTM